MKDEATNANSRPNSRRTLHVLTGPSRKKSARAAPFVMDRKTWLGVISVTLFVCCAVGLVLYINRARLIRRPSAQQERIQALVEQLTSLTQSDLIVFSDGRIWYVRAVHGKNMEVVGWIGSNIRSENIDSFVLTEGKFTIVRHNEPSWPAQRDRYFKQQ